MSSSKEATDNSSIEDEGSDSDYDEIDDYYNNNDDDLGDSDEEDIGSGISDQKGQGDARDNNNVKKFIQDLEYFEYECFSPQTVDEKLDSECTALANRLKITPSLALLVMQENEWRSSNIIQSALSVKDRTKILVRSGVQCASSPPPVAITSTSRQLGANRQECGVCMDICPRQKLYWLPCTHSFCKDCWSGHIEYTIRNGMKSGVPCMAEKCNLVCPRDFIEQFLNMQSNIGSLFKRLLRNNCIVAHYQMRFCPGRDCEMVMYAAKPKARRVECKKCLAVFCFECGSNYHSPTDCATVKRWLTKCGDDSETANYIYANTKNCPRCHICIEKNGGCNHIQCSKCKFDFCWMCLCDWKSHGNSYYVCSRYNENPLIAEQNQQVQAREALKKYLFYFERWENHNQSLQLEAEARKKIHKQIEEKVMNNEGTWIDWQYLLRAGELLAKCRSTLQNTYPLAYYSPPGPEKELFEYQQAQLELEIEELSWKLENAGSYQRGDIENQMDVAVKRHHTLLSHFLRD